MSMKFRPGEMVKYKTPDMERAYFIMIESVIRADNYRAFPISPGFNFPDGHYGNVEGKHLTRIL